MNQWFFRLQLELGRYDAIVCRCGMRHMKCHVEVYMQDWVIHVIVREAVEMPCLINSDLCYSSVIQGFGMLLCLSIPWYGRRPGLLVLEQVAISELKQTMALRLQFVELEPSVCVWLVKIPMMQKLNVILWRLNAGCLQWIIMWQANYFGCFVFA